MDDAAPMTSNKLKKPRVELPAARGDDHRHCRVLQEGWVSWWCGRGTLPLFCLQFITISSRGFCIHVASGSLMDDFILPLVETVTRQNLAWHQDMNKAPLSSVCLRFQQIKNGYYLKKWIIWTLSKKWFIWNFSCKISRAVCKAARWNCSMQISQ